MKSLKGIYLLRDMQTNLWDGSKFYATNILNSFFYLSLKEKNRNIYDEYRELVNTTCKRVYKRRPNTKVAPYETFYSIYEDIRDNGFETDSYVKFGLGTKRYGQFNYRWTASCFNSVILRYRHSNKMQRQNCCSAL